MIILKEGQDITEILIDKIIKTIHDNPTSKTLELADLATTVGKIAHATEIVPKLTAMYQISEQVVDEAILLAIVTAHTLITLQNNSELEVRYMKLPEEDEKPVETGEILYENSNADNPTNISNPQRNAQNLPEVPLGSQDNTTR